jgi:polysaccharide biosynthesis transport protein
LRRYEGILPILAFTLLPTIRNRKYPESSYSLNQERGLGKQNKSNLPITMNDLHHLPTTPKEFVHILLVRWRLWLIPTVIVSLAAVFFALVRTNTWEASQALIIRSEAVNNDRGPGKFTQPEEMKTIQETILELARSRGVIEAALKQVGPPVSCKNFESWPTDRDIQVCRNSVKLVPPKGAEFGKTEVFYLTVRDCDRVRAIELNQAIFDQLQAGYQELRDAKARSIVDELTKTVTLAKTDLAESTSRITATETEIGADLAELRSMQDVGGSESSLRRSVEEIRSQLREARTTAKAGRELLNVLHEAQDDPGRLLAVPNQLLESQPALKKLKDGLVDAQLNSAKLQGTRSAEHPLVKAAFEAEEEIGRHLHNELAIAIRGMEIEVRLHVDRQNSLENQLAAATSRLNHLAEIRASYETQTAENRNRTGLAERAEQNLAEARAELAGAKAVNLISRIDKPDTGANPVGPSRTVIALLGVVGGLISGLGMVFLALPSKSLTLVPAPETNVADRDHLSSTPAAETVVIGHNPYGHNSHNGHGPLSFKKALEKIHGNGHK